MMSSTNRPIWAIHANPWWKTVIVCRAGIPALVADD